MPILSASIFASQVLCIGTCCYDHSIIFNLSSLGIFVLHVYFFTTLVFKSLSHWVKTPFFFPCWLQVFVCHKFGALVLELIPTASIEELKKTNSFSSYSFSLTHVFLVEFFL